MVRAITKKMAFLLFVATQSSILLNISEMSKTIQSSPGYFFTQISLRGTIQTICFRTIDSVRAIRKKMAFFRLF